ncbi:MAG: DNA adenine methylase, partial [Bacteroidia bacterium]
PARQHGIVDKNSCNFRKIITSCFSAVDIMKLFISTPAGTRRRFIFLDPPYKHSTRPRNIKIYGKNEMKDIDHVQLLSSATDLKDNCMIIHPKCELYDDILHDWRKIPLKLRYHRKTSNECLYMNYDKPVSLQTDVYLGKDRTDRQRIKRKGERFIKKFSELDALERKYILDRLNTIK